MTSRQIQVEWINFRNVPQPGARPGSLSNPNLTVINQVLESNRLALRRDPNGTGYLSNSKIVRESLKISRGNSEKLTAPRDVVKLTEHRSGPRMFPEAF
jgi:hypothetical protein